MEIETIVRWMIAIIPLLIAAYIAKFNISRQFINQKNRRQGIQETVSGTCFLGTIFALCGLALAPIEFKWWFYLIAVVEIPALINFSSEVEDEKAVDEPDQND